MNKADLFRILREQDRETLLALLQIAYDLLNYDDRRSIFGEYVQEIPPLPVDGETLLAEITQFVTMSRDGYYYAPFQINSKNFMEAPAETEQWFKKLGDLLQDSCQLTAQEAYRHAVACFGLLYELIEEMERGEEIVFGDEIGSWMIPGDEKQYLSAYIAAVAHTGTPEAFADIVIPLARRDSGQSLTGEVYTAACRTGQRRPKRKTRRGDPAIQHPDRTMVVRNGL